MYFKYVMLQLTAMDMEQPLIQIKMMDVIVIVIKDGPVQIAPLKVISNLLFHIFDKYDSFHILGV